MPIRVDKELSRPQHRPSAVLGLDLDLAAQQLGDVVHGDRRPWPSAFVGVEVLVSHGPYVHDGTVAVDHCVDRPVSLASVAQRDMEGADWGAGAGD